MTTHARLQALLVGSGGLSPAEKELVREHLLSCSECRELLQVIQQNRERLRALATLRPPASTRRAVIEAADRTGEALSFWGPLLFAFCIPGIALLLVALLLSGGILAVSAACGLIAAILTTLWVLDRRQRELEDVPAPGRPALWDLGRDMAADLLGLSFGITALMLLLWLSMTLASQ